MGNPLVAFALVAEEYEKSGDPIRGLKPLFAPILAGKHGLAFDPIKFSEDFTNLYGLEMSPFVADALAERLVAIDLLVRVTGERSGECRYKISEFDWSPDKIDEQQIDQTIRLFIKWAKNKAATCSRQYVDAELEEAILVRLARPEFASIFIDTDGIKKTNKLKQMLGIGAVDPTATNDIYLDYLVAEFVLTSDQSAPEVFKSISLIAYGSLVADAVVGLAVPQNSEQPDPPLRVVLDGPLILDLLDMSTVEHHSYAAGLIGVIKDAGMRLAVFDHSIDEVRGSIRSTLHAYGKGSAFGPLAERFRTTPGYTLFANSVADTLESKIAELGITVLRSEIYEEARFKKYFPDERVDRIRNSIGDLHENIDARIRDAKSVATVVRLKADNRQASSVLQAGTIFVTRNSVLCKRVLRALSVGYSEPNPRFTVATDGQIAGVLWFIYGARGIELSRKRLIANCSSAILPRRDVISRIASMLNTLDSKLSEEFSVLMTDRRASMCPMRMTGGLVDVIDKDRSIEVLKSMREALSAPVLERAMDAEARSTQYKIELERTAATSKEAVLALQNNIETEEELRRTDKINFDSQLAQLDIELANANRIIESKNKEGENRSSKIRLRIRDAEQGVVHKEKRARRIIELLLSLIVVGPTAASILFPEFGGWPFRVLLLIVYVASLKNITAWKLKLMNSIIDKLFKADRRYIAGLKDAS